jgi:hypothetical protein
LEFHTVSFDAIGVRSQVTVVDGRALGTAADFARGDVAALDCA